MTPKKINPLIRVFPSLTDVAFLLPIFLLILRTEGLTQMLEGDTGWHIRTGEWIMTNGQVPQKDFFSFSMPDGPWFAWEWLWDVIFAWLHQHGGMEAVVGVSLVILCFTSAALYRLALNKCGNALIAAAVTMIAVVGSSLHWLARPHLFTMLFAVIFLIIIEHKHEAGRNWLWSLPVLTLVWTNLHGGFFVGILLLGAYAAGEIITAVTSSDTSERTNAVRRGKEYAITASACALVSLINPYSYKLHLHILKYLGNPESPFFRFVSEWQSISFHAPQARFFEVLIVLSLGASAWHLYQRRFAYPILLTGWLHLALGMARNIPLFLIVAAPFVAQAMVEIISLARESTAAGWIRRSADTFNEIASEATTFDRVRRFHLVSAGGVLLFFALMYLPSPQEKFQAVYDPKTYPIKALQKLPVASLTGRVFTSDEWGDYLIYRLYPSTKSFIDGRFDYYGEKFTQTYLDLMNAKHNWQAILDQHRIDTVLLPVDVAVVSALKESPRWRVTYDDGVAIAFRLSRSGEAAQPTSSHVANQDSGKNGDRKITELQIERKRRL